MKIYGFGTDLVDTKRITAAFKRSKLFKERIFSTNEMKFCEKKKDKINCYGKRFAAKEAFSKALGTGISKGLNFNEIEIFNNKLGKPYIKVKGKSLLVVYKIIKKKKFNTLVSLSDQKPFAMASVIITI
tara:strand:+ start:2870 stop:3256 length:387 start_codon:yes stop_codon:yes gene_type:complete